MPILNRNQISEITQVRKEVEIPEWGGSVLVRGLNAADDVEISRLEKEQSARDMERLKKLAEINNSKEVKVIAEAETEAPFNERLFSISQCVYDGFGNRIFPGGEKDKELLKVPQTVLNKLYMAIIELSNDDNFKSWAENLKKKLGKGSSSASAETSESSTPITSASTSPQDSSESGSSSIAKSQPEASLTMASA